MEMRRSYFQNLVFIIFTVFLLYSCEGVSKTPEHPQVRNEDSTPTCPEASLGEVQSDNPNDQASQEILKPPGINLSPSEAESTIHEQADEIIRMIKRKDFAALSSHIHPCMGVRFSPYEFITEDDLVFSAEEILNLMDDEHTYTWGIYDGRGTPIELTFSEYWDRFVYSHDFANAEQISYNQPLGRGTMINNSQEFYPGSIIVEYHFPGFDPKYEGMDWVSLSLVFQQHGEQWYLAGIVHGEWTI